MKRLVAVSVGGTMALLLSSCGTTSSGPDAQSSDFQGLDQSITAEVLSNPLAMKKIAEEPAATRDSMAQGIALNFFVCRDAYRVYKTWFSTGQQPELKPLPTPASPKQPSYADWKHEYRALQEQVGSGEPQQLRDWLTLNGSCGKWIPAKAGDTSGPTISDAVTGGK